MKKRKLSKPTPRGLPSLKELDKLMTGLDLGEMGPPRSGSSMGPGFPALAYLQGSLTSHHFIKEINNQCDYEKNFFITAYVH